MIDEDLEIKVVASHCFLCPGALKFKIEKNGPTAPAVIDVYSDGSHVVSCTSYLVNGMCGLNLSDTLHPNCSYDKEPKNQD